VRSLACWISPKGKLTKLTVWRDFRLPPLGEGVEATVCQLRRIWVGDSLRLAGVGDSGVTQDLHPPAWITNGGL